MSKFKEEWDKLDAGRKRLFVLIGVGAFVFFILWGYVAGDEKTVRKPAPPQPIVKAPLTGTRDSSLGVEALAAKISRLEGEVKTLRGEAEMSAERNNANLDKLKQDSLRREADLKQQLSEARNRMGGFENALEQAAKQPTIAEVAALSSEDSGSASDPSSRQLPRTTLSDNPAVIDTEWSIFDTDATSVISDEDGQGSDGRRSGGGGTASLEPPAAPQIQTIGELDSPVTPAEAAAAAKTSALQIPSGSILKGVLLTGVDAPTGQQSRTTPMPSLLRIKHEGILPNFYSWDVTECFVLLSGYGDLSTERYMARAERLSCVSDKQQVLDIELEAFASGEDGKAGIRGRLVTRMGQALLNGGIAGFFGGAAQAFSPQRLPTINNNSDDELYTPSASLVLGTGAGQGASQALNQIAEFYINLAEQTLPVVEVDAAREVELVLVRPLVLPESTLARR